MILEAPRDTNVTITEELVLDCTASGFPVPMISWIHNGTVIDPEESDQVTIIQSRQITSTLRVTSTTLSHSGDYVCSAASPTFNMVTSQPVLVLVQCKLFHSFQIHLYVIMLCSCIPYTADRPEQPQNVTAVNVTSRSLTLEWTEPHHNNAPILGYRVMYQPSISNSTVMEINTVVTFVEITGLHPGETYFLTVVAFNAIGDSAPSDLALAITLEEGI